MVGRGRAAVAADEAHRRPALALPGVVEEVADDQPEVSQVPVQGLTEPGGLQHDVAEPLDLRRRRGGRWVRVGPRRPRGRSCSVSGCCARAAPAARACRRRPAPAPARVDQVDARPRRRSPAASRPSAPVASASRTRSAGSRRAERRADEPRPRARGGPARTAPRRRCPAAAARPAVRSTDGEPERVANRSARARSGFSNSSQARSCTLMTGFARPPGCSPRSAPCSLCSPRCGSRRWPCGWDRPAVPCHHDPLPRHRMSSCIMSITL